MDSQEYFTLLSKRAEKTRAFSAFQDTGTLVSEILGDPKHIALYIKIAKKVDSRTLVGTAKGIVERGHIQCPGAYFMRIAKEKGWLTHMVSVKKKKDA